MTKDEALRLALKALEGVLDDSPKVLDASISGGLYEVVQCRDAITAIKAALETKEESWEKFCDSNCVWTDHHPDCKLAKDEPVAYINVEQRKLEWAKYVSWGTPTVVNLPKIPLYTTPPQRTWVGLTDEETVAIELGLRIPTGYRDAYDLSLRDFAKAIEAKLKEKNT